MSVTRLPSARRAAARNRRTPRLHVLELEGRLAPAVFNIPNGDVAAFVAAINACNTNNQPDVINLAGNGIYTFTARVDNDTGGTALPIVRLDGGIQKNSLNINGHGATVQRSSAPGTPGFRFLTVGPGDGTARIRAVDTAVSDLTVRGFDVTAMSEGSAFLGQWASLRLTNCVMTGNASMQGGAVRVYGPRTPTVSLDRCVITSDVSEQGGWASINVQGPILSVSNCLIANGTGGQLSGIMYSGGDSCTITDTVIRDYPWYGLFILANLTMSGCTVSGNSSGGLRVQGSDLTVSDCAFTGNGSAESAGGIALASHRATISNSTFDGNQALSGGGISIGHGIGVTIIGVPEVLPDVSIFGCTITGNRVEIPSYLQPGNPNLYASGGGVWLEAGSLRIASTVIAGNTLSLRGKPGDGPDVSGNVASLLYSFIGNGSGMTVTGPTTGSQVGTAAAPLDPRLGPLQDNGGPTLTRLPRSNSPLVNAGDPNFTPPPQFDQRGPGFPRVRDGRIDIGATEPAFVHDLAVTLSDGRRVAPAGGTTTYTAIVQNTGDFTEGGSTFTLPLPPGAAAMTWTSTAAGGAAGNTPSGTGPISETLDLPSGSSVTYTVTVTLAPMAAGQLVATAQVAVPPGVTDEDPSNNSATDTDAILVGGIVAVGAGIGGPPQASLFAARDGAPLYSFLAYDPAFRGGVSVAVADFNADGVPDVVTSPGPGGGPHVRVFDGATGAVLREWFAYDPTFFGGVFVAAGDVTGDGTPDVVTGAGPGGGPHVKVFDGNTGALVSQWMAYDVAFRGGVSVAAGDVDGDGRADVVTGAGPGGGPHVKVFAGATGALLAQAFAYEADFRGGVWVAAGDVDGDGRAEVITAPGDGGGPFVKVLRGSDLSLLRGFFAYDPAFRGGARVAAVDATGDGKADIATAAGPGGGPHVKLFDGDAGSDLYGLMAFAPAFRGGIFVGAG